MLQASDTTTLTRRDCERLLAGSAIGRVVFTDQALPAAFPVNFAMLGADIVFRTAARGVLARVCDGQVVAFQADHVDGTLAEGWSVLVVGSGEILTSPHDVVRADQLGIISLAAPHGCDVYVRIVPGIVTGRRIGAALAGRDAESA